MPPPLPGGQLQHRLDARDAVFRGALWAVCLHPLSSRTVGELDSALSQEVILVETYGTSHRSGELRFGPAG